MAIFEKAKGFLNDPELEVVDAVITMCIKLGRLDMLKKEMACAVIERILGNGETKGVLFDPNPLRVTIAVRAIYWFLEKLLIEEAKIEEIVDGVKELLFQENCDKDVMIGAVSVIVLLGKSGLLSKVKARVIKEICAKAKELLDHREKQWYALTIRKAFVETGLLK